VPARRFGVVGVNGRDDRRVLSSQNCGWVADRGTQQASEGELLVIIEVVLAPIRLPNFVTVIGCVAGGAAEMVIAVVLKFSRM